MKANSRVKGEPTDTNIYVLDRYIYGSDAVNAPHGVITQVEVTSLPHLRRLIKAGWLVATPAVPGGVVLSPLGRDGLASWRERSPRSRHDPGEGGMSRPNPERDDFELPPAEEVEAHLLAKEIAKLMKRRKRKPLWGGGSRAFYSPLEWRARGESCGNGAALVVVHDGGDAASYFNWDYGDEKAAEAMGKLLSKLGYFAESCSSWATGIYHRA
jgi:hypothetical protein